MKTPAKGPVGQKGDILVEVKDLRIEGISDDGLTVTATCTFRGR